MRVPPAHRLIAGAVLVASLLAALPQSAQAPWSRAMAGVLWIPLWPLTAPLSALRDAVRAPQAPYAGLPEELQEALAARDRVQGERDAALLRLREVEAELAELTGFRPGRQDGWRPRLATVIARGVGRPAGLFRIDVGSAQGVAAGDPVVVGGNRLVGRVAGGGEEARSLVVPLDDARIGRLDSIVVPASDAASGARPKVLVQLRAVRDRDGLLVGELESKDDIRPGDPVLLEDATWPAAARGMRVGTVERVGTLDSNPLRRRIDVRMDVDPARLGRVVVKVSGPGGPP
jgi:cell shape-determining protein MreC